MTEPTPLRAWLDQAWNDHPEQPRQVADALAERAASLPDDADGAEALRLAEHTLLAHLADAPSLERLLAATPPHPALAAALQRARWALDTLAGTPATALPDGLRWRALHSVVMVLVARGDVAQARERLLAEAPAATTSDDTDAAKGYAATANNAAADLRHGPRGDAARDALMIEAAELSRRAWARVGTWMHTERADYQVALCHAAIGQGAQAVAYAQACLDRCEAEGADASERFFAHEALVHAHRAAGDAAEAARQREHMQALLAGIADADMHAWCEKTLADT
ncbi:MAG TPA: hypothetical protein VLA16_19590 [Ideonella sp.]|nr:hypothetical protein [Ideonella sp.]